MPLHLCGGRSIWSFPGAPLCIFSISRRSHQSNVGYNEHRSATFINVPLQEMEGERGERGERERGEREREERERERREEGHTILRWIKKEEEEIEARVWRLYVTTTLVFRLTSLSVTCMLRRRRRRRGAVRRKLHPFP